VLVEHTVLSEVLFALLLAGGLYAGVRAFDEPRAIAGALTSRHLWLLAAGLLIGLSTWARAVSSPLVPGLALFFALAIPGTVWTRIGRGALAGGAATVLVLVYFGLNSSETGTFGFNQAPGWTIYARAAPFADCTQFAPPPSVAKELCEGTPKDERAGPDYYAWSKRSPAERLYGYPPAGDETLGEFGRSAILHQPRDYLTAVGRDTLRYFFPEINNEQLLGGTDYEYLDIHRRDRPIERDVQRWLDYYYDPEPPSIDQDALDTLTEVQQVLRVQPILMLQAVILGALGIAFARGRVRAALVLLLGSSLVLLVFAAAITTYNARYTIPIGGPLIAAGAIGLWVCLSRFGGRRPGDAEPVSG
jgi:hypothetical protein